MRAAGNRIGVLVVDDSAVVRQTLAAILGADPEIEVIAVASDPYVAVQRIAQRIPDVILLDIEMPRMDGITFLQKIMSQHPIPVVMCSGQSDQGCADTLRALEYGAVDVITKPKMGVKRFLEESEIVIRDSVKAAAHAKLRPARRPTGPIERKLTADAVIAKPSAKTMVAATERVVVVGASTGGTEAIRELLGELPADAPGMVIVQHMPEKFTSSFAERLDRECAISVKEAVDGDAVIRGRVLIAPGNRHSLLKRSGSNYHVEVKEGPLVCRHRPSVDVLFRSAARYAGKNAIGVILTGMGDDGAKGMHEMHEVGSATIAQDEASCVVFGMPKEAIGLGGVDKVVPLRRIALEILKLCA